MALETRGANLVYAMVQMVGRKLRLRALVFILVGLFKTDLVNFSSIYCGYVNMHFLSIESYPTKWHLHGNVCSNRSAFEQAYVGSSTRETAQIHGSSELQDSPPIFLDDSCGWS